ncbi:hypothetical protein Aperf_G00000083120 [Anoplocephala perfoliata]
MFEILTCGMLPYAELNTEVVKLKVLGGYRLPSPTVYGFECPDNIYRVMQACWNIDPNQRPTFREIYFHIQEELIKIDRYYSNVALLNVEENVKNYLVKSSLHDLNSGFFVSLRVLRYFFATLSFINLLIYLQKHPVGFRLKLPYHKNIDSQINRYQRQQKEILTCRVAAESRRGEA